MEGSHSTKVATFLNHPYRETSFFFYPGFWLIHHMRNGGRLQSLMLPFLPQSPQAQSIANLFGTITIVAILILLLVTGLVIFAMIRFRSRGSLEPQSETHDRARLEITWTALPILLLTVVFGLTVSTMQKSDPPAAAGQAPDVIIIAHQWWWEVHYPKAGVVTANEVHMAAGQRYLFKFESADVIHDFWVPQLGRKIDMIPGHPNQMFIQADQVGTYSGTCAEYCGAEHAWMRIRVLVQSPDDFNAWLKAQAQVPSPPTTGDAVQGAQLFQQLTCASCHTIAGTPAQANIGPDLTHIASRQTIGSGVLDNNPHNLTAWISNPQAIKPGILMPNLALSSQQVQELVAYLETLK
jgi:cytochrome c oxidase subunit 2